MAGNSLWKVYPRQFPKLLTVLVKRYFPKMKNIGDETADGPMGRLEHFLEKCMTQGFIPPPEGELSKNFW